MSVKDKGIEMILYYTHRKFGELAIVDNCFVRLVDQARRLGIKLVVVVPPQNNQDWLENHYGEDINFIFRQSEGKGSCDIYARIMRGLELAEGNEVVYMAEHDVLYCDEHFFHDPGDCLAYNVNRLFLAEWGFYWRKRRDSHALSLLCGSAEKMRNGFAKKQQELETNGRVKWIEPGADRCNDFSTGIPCVDIRHDCNHTGGAKQNNDFKSRVIDLNWDAGELWRKVNGNLLTMDLHIRFIVLNVLKKKLMEGCER